MGTAKEWKGVREEYAKRETGGNSSIILIKNRCTLDTTTHWPKLTKHPSFFTNHCLKQEIGNWLKKVLGKRWVFTKKPAKEWNGVREELPNTKGITGGCSINIQKIEKMGT